MGAWNGGGAWNCCFTVPIPVAVHDPARCHPVLCHSLELPPGAVTGDRPPPISLVAQSTLTPAQCQLSAEDANQGSCCPQLEASQPQGCHAQSQPSDSPTRSIEGPRESWLTLQPD